MSNFDICVMVSVWALAIAAIFIAHKINQKLCCQIDGLKEKLDEARAEADKLRKRLDEAAEDALAAQIESDENEKSALGLRMRCGGIQMIKVHDAADRHVASLSETYLYKTFGIRKSDYAGCIVDIFIHKGRRNHNENDKKKQTVDGEHK